MCEHMTKFLLVRNFPLRVVAKLLANSFAAFEERYRQSDGAHEGVATGSPRGLLPFFPFPQIGPLFGRFMIFGGGGGGRNA